MKRNPKPQRSMTSSLSRPSKEAIQQLQRQSMTTPRGEIIGNTQPKGGNNQPRPGSAQPRGGNNPLRPGNMKGGNMMRGGGGGGGMMRGGSDFDLGNLGNTRHPSQSMHAIPTKPAEMKVKQMSEREFKMAKALAPTKGYNRGGTSTRAQSAAASSGLIDRSTAMKRGAKLQSIVPPFNNDTSQVDFPIDIVYTWVDGSDEEWQKSRQKFTPTQKNIPVDSLSECRWRDFDELRLSVESVEKFAPWVRTIFIISDFQRPYWFDENNPGKIKFIDHPDLFQEFEEHLPTFNSHSIEAHLHRIPDLAEHFIYSNDDTFFGNYVYPLDFFTADGTFKVFVTETDLATEKSIREYVNTVPKPPVLNAVNSKLNPKLNHSKPTPTLDRIDIVPYFTSQAVTNNVLDQVLGPSPMTRKRLKHQMKALRVSTYEWCWENELMQMYLFNTSSTRFRSLGDIDPTTLVSHAGLSLGEAIPASITSTYYGITDETDLNKVFNHLKSTQPMSKLYCINDSLKNPTEDKLTKIRNAMERHLPHKHSI